MPQLVKEEDFRESFQKLLENNDHEGWKQFQVKYLVNTSELPISEQKFYRQQKAQGFKFKKLQADVRFNFAINLMKKGNLTQSEVATRVFYESNVEFNKAFKKWSGQTPDKYMSSIK